MSININKSKLLFIIGVILAVIAIFMAGFYAHAYYETQQTNSAKNVAKAFVADLVNGKTDAAYSLTSKSLQSKQDKAAFAKAIGDVKSSKPAYGDSQYIMRQGKFYYAQRALNLPKTSSGSTTGDFSLVLVRQGTVWRVLTVSVQ
jgi:hypothetical protein